MSPDGKIADPEAVLTQFPAVAVFPHIIETDPSEQMLYAVMNLAATRNEHGVDPALTDDEAVAAIQEVYNAPPPEHVPDATERMAAAVEFQNVLAMASMMEATAEGSGI